LRYKFLIVDVFSAEPFGGNQLAVLPEAAGITSEGMQRIAREFNFAETTFVLPPKDGANDARVRIFTPRAELPFAGHPTVGTASVLVLSGRAKAGALVLELGVGPLAVEVRQASGQATWAAVTRLGQPEERPSLVTEAQVAEILGLKREDVRDCFDASVGLPFCFARLKDRASVDAARLDRHACIRQLSGGWASGVFLFAGRPANGGELYARMFAPALGIDEDPATGSACAALVGVLAARSGLADGEFELSITQGVAMGRRSDITASARLDDSQVASVSVGGFVTKIVEGEVDLPPSLRLR
jgi:trans-2,3-dihydro-3-hydroxyanthranilate isomerase